MLKIDIHTHILPKNWPDLKEKFGYGGWIHLDHYKCGCARMMKDEQFFREVEENCWDPETRIKEYQEFNIDVQVISTVPVMFSYWAAHPDALFVSQFLNDHIAQVVNDFPKKYIGLGTIPMQAPDLAIPELERCVKKLGLAGIQIGSHINDWNLDQAELFPIFQAAEELGAAIFIHPWEMMGADTMNKYWLPWLVGMPAESSRAICSLIFGGVLERCPNLRIAIAHGGGSFPATIGRIAHGFDVRPDLCAVDNSINPRHYVDKLFYDSLVHDEPALRFLTGTVGVSQVALGSDYPFPLGELEPGSLIQQSNFCQSDKEKLLSTNALKWLSLSNEQFL